MQPLRGAGQGQALGGFGEDLQLADGDVEHRE